MTQTHRFWLLIADASSAKIFGGRGPNGTLEPLQEFANPQGRAPERDLVTDRPGRNSDPATAHLSAHETNPKDKIIEGFVREIAAFIDTAHTRQEFEHLSIVAGPSVLGILRDKFSDPVRKSVLEEVVKDLSGKDVSEIQSHLTQLHPR